MLGKTLIVRTEQALEGQKVSAIDHGAWQDCCQDRLTTDTHLQANDVAFVIQASGHLALRDWVKGAVQHVFFTTPDHLDRGAGNLLGNLYRLPNVVVKRTTAAKATA